MQVAVETTEVCIQHVCVSSNLLVRQFMHNYIPFLSHFVTTIIFWKPMINQHIVIAHVYHWSSVRYVPGIRYSKKYILVIILFLNNLDLFIRQHIFSGFEIGMIDLYLEFVSCIENYWKYSMLMACG